MIPSALGFAAPMALIALAALPAIWLLLRVTPPQPRRIVFPPLRLFADLAARRETPARTPWWLLALRLLIAACVILAAAGPLWNPVPDAPAGARGPLLLVLDNGFASARDWRERTALAADRMAAAGRSGRAVVVLATADRPGELTPQEAGAAQQRLRAIVPAPYTPDRRVHLAAIERLVAATPGVEIEWISDGVTVTSAPPATPAGVAQGPQTVPSVDDAAAFVTGLSQLADAAGAKPGVTVYRTPRSLALALAGTNNAAHGLEVTVIRPPPPSGRDSGIARALDIKGLPLGEARFGFPAGTTETTARFELPIELRNAVARIDIVDEPSAGAVALVDESSQRRRIGVVTGATVDVAQPLLSPTYYVGRALAPFADVREPRAGTIDTINTLIGEKVSVIVLADVGSLDRDTAEKLDAFVAGGGVLIRFAGSRLAAGNDELVPVRLRRGGRSLGGSLSWDAPKTLAPFPRESPFFGLAVPGEITVRRQILAEPDGELAGKTWAALADGTPIVTADKRGDGLLVLFHVTADPSWSNLPLSGIFVDMLRRIVALSGKPTEAADPATGRVETAAPQRTLDGFGTFRAPPATAKPVARSFAGRGTEDHPPGFYGPNEALMAVNALVPGDRFGAIDMAPLNARLEGIGRPAVIDLRMPLLLAAALLVLVDSIASLLLGGYRPRLGRRSRPTATAAVVMAATFAVWAAPPREARAQPAPPGAPPAAVARSPAEAPLRKAEVEAALVTRLAYVTTGDTQVDATSRAGLVGLSQALAQRTAMEPGEPAGVDPARDELAFYPVLYWPVVAGRPLPSEAALRRLDSYMKGGGTVVFDTRDALSGRASGATSPEGQQLRRMLATLDVPQLEPVPRDHVLTKAFYLVDTFPGRYGSGQTWVEALPAEPEGERAPARAGDGVSPIIITSNDLAAAWAVGRRGEPLYPVVGHGEARQREMAIRGGVNIVMYALTGNYKADQVHVPALLERLGQ
ncbi:DUF4159 domain-containing protein [Chelatococcus reniformis]|uniref:LytTR family transcriptional regulator n=1 Tax=Chelatococcus reniformis TaxID=1494448 RepID=A0A916UNM5_9HYPH|nr:DUF4159 domain-containing protein [Chelatococcus reniformis]GGC80611.1 LytTR family transcriptional regulator [Chelatococcus reniformis]